MCWFITLAVNGEAAEKVRISAHTHSSVNVAESSGTTACALFKPEMAKFLITMGGCSCSLFHEIRTAKLDSEKKRAQLRRKGWSEAKIERALAESCEANKRNAEARDAARDVQARRFREFVVSVFDEGAEVQVYCHSYQGSVVSEQLTRPVHLRVTRAQFLASGFPAESVVSVAG
ncbi:MAG: hypothetical protein J0I77_11295 [Rudaea sp.]|uniref:hypothetical protein n=1 Tax=unclassified Rudaea TaxID=2627037 RepID=UPI0010F48DE7|nr:MULTISPECIES: hypothetical protein [unclassified Rudaea]MBN8886296.1 hypothetical protein [Rudaea sp.]MBR0344335.1 hypothetical protein [Rudaea sp.]